MNRFFTQHRAAHLSLLFLAWPMILSNISVPLLGLVDTAVIGHLASSKYLAGVALGAMVVNLVFWLAGFLRMSMTGLAAQAYGGNNVDELLSELKKGLLIAAGLGLLLLILQPLIVYSLKFMLTGSAQAVEQALIYIEIRLFSAPAALCNMVLLGWLLGTQYSKGPFYILLANNITNILLDVLFVVVFEWAVAGAAMASVMSDYLALAVALYILRSRFQVLGVSFKHVLHAKVSGVSEFLSLNLAIFIRSLFLQICFAFMTFYGATMGDHIVAANAVLLNFLLLVSFALDGIAYAVEAKVGEAKGQGSDKRIRLWVKLSVFWGVLFSFLYSLIFILFGEHIISLLSDIPEVIATAHTYLLWLVLLPPVASFCFIFDGVFVGLTRAKEMRNAMVFSSLIGFFGVFLLSMPLLNHGLWLAMTCFMLLRGLTLIKKYRDLVSSGCLLR